jgi:MoaA/NifB/PqqE/SkfB family radical SAM enzyme
MTAPLVVVWRVLDTCNLACPFCAYDKRLPTARSQAALEEIERFIAVLGDWSWARRRPVLLSWLGGEPLLWKPLEGLTRRARAAGLLVSTTTNGSTLASPRSRAHLLDAYREVTISIDGFGDFHDAMRGWPGAFEKLRAGIQVLVRERAATGSALKIRVNVVLMRDNCRRFPDLCHELADWGVDEICFNQLGGRDRPEFFPDHRLTPDDVEALRTAFPALRQALAARSVRVLGGEAYLQRIHDTTRDLPLPISDCRVADDFLFIDEQGLVAPCNFTSQHFQRSILNIDGPDALDALAGGLNADQRSKPAGACADCHSTQQFSKFGPQAALLAT